MSVYLTSIPMLSYSSMSMMYMALSSHDFSQNNRLDSVINHCVLERLFI